MSLLSDWWLPATPPTTMSTSISPSQMPRHDGNGSLHSTKTESLKPRAVVATHKRPENDDSPEIFEQQVPAERHSRQNRQRSAGRLFVDDRTGVRERLVHRSIRAESARLACTPYRTPQPNPVSTPNAFRSLHRQEAQFHEWRQTSRRLRPSHEAAPEN